MKKATKLPISAPRSFKAPPVPVIVTKRIARSSPAAKVALSPPVAVASTAATSTAKDIHDLAHANAHFVTMMFLPEAWQKAAVLSPSWRKTSFPPVPRSTLPKLPGVYVFVVTPNIFDFDSGNALFYVGKATSLYHRVAAYIGEIDKEFKLSNRPMVWRMLNQWKGHLQYFFTTTATVELAEQLEDEMIRAFRPPFNKQYDAETSKIMRAF
ncbi:MAG: hypothetical protein V4754_12040 [Pseudomonadota bacterium]